MAIISMAVVLSITGCNQNADEDSAFQTLDIEQLETDTTDINDRAEYYDKNVDDRIDEMTDEEKEKFYVNLTLTYTGREYYEEDYIIFLRNDNDQFFIWVLFISLQCFILSIHKYFSAYNSTLYFFNNSSIFASLSIVIT